MWERIPDIFTSQVYSHRLKVPGGWIVRTVALHMNGGCHVSQLFVEDAPHLWKLEK